MTTQDEIDALRAATREAHEAAQELKQARKEAMETLDKVRAVVRGEVESLIEAEVHRALGELGTHTRRYIDLSVRKVISEFDKLGEKIMGKGPARLDRLAERALQSGSLSPRCDFCAVQGTWLATHLTEKFELPETKEFATYVDDGGWAACPECDTLIRAGDRAGLAKRSAEQLGKSAASVRRLLAGFWDHYLGPEERPEEKTSS